MRVKIATVLLVFLLIHTPLSVKALMQGETEEMVAYIESLGALPEFCRYKMASTKFRQNRSAWPPGFEKSLNNWIRRLTPLNWTYVHHYCFGIREVNEYITMAGKTKEGKTGEHQLRGALAEFKFVERSRAAKTFPFWYEIYNYEHFIYLRLGEYGNAQNTKDKANEYKNRRESNK